MDNGKNMANSLHICNRNHIRKLLPATADGYLIVWKEIFPPNVLVVTGIETGCFIVGLSGNLGLLNGGRGNCLGCLHW